MRLTFEYGNIGRRWETQKKLDEDLKNLTSTESSSTESSSIELPAPASSSAVNEADADPALEYTGRAPSNKATRVSQPLTFPTMFDVGLWLSGMNTENEDRMLPILPAPVFENGADLCSTPIETLVNATVTNNTADKMKPTQALAALWQESICMLSTDAARNKTIRSLLATEDLLKTLHTAEEVIKVAWLNQTMTQQAHVDNRASTSSLTQSILTGEFVKVDLRGCLLYRKPHDQWSYMLCTDGSQREGVWRLHSLESQERKFNPSISSSMKANQLTSMGLLVPQEQPPPTFHSSGEEYSYHSLDHEYANGDKCSIDNSDESEPDDAPLYSTTVTYDCCHTDDTITELDQYVVKYNGRWPNCQNLVPVNEGDACFDGQSIDWIKKMCDEDFRCTGFSWNNGNGCWKVLCLWGIIVV